MSYPLGSVFIRVPVSRPDLRHLFNFAVTSFFLLAIMDMWSAYVQLLTDILLTYYVAQNVKTARMPWIVFGSVCVWIVIASFMY